MALQSLRCGNSGEKRYSLNDWCMSNASLSVHGQRRRCIDRTNGNGEVEIRLYAVRTTIEPVSVVYRSGEWPYSNGTDTSPKLSKRIKDVYRMC